MLMVKGKKKISRRRPGEKETKAYFTMDTQEAIVSFQKETDVDKRNQIYLEKIFPAFSTLIENLINVFGYHVMYETKTDLKNECLEYMYGVLPKYDQEKGSKAFSYFNVCAKNWLTIQSKNNAKKIQTYVSISDRDALTKHEMSIIENFDVVPSAEDTMIHLESSDNLKKIISELKAKIKTENEVLTISAIADISEKLEDLDLLSKRAVMCYIREITGLNSKQLSIVLSSLKKHYKEVRKNEFNE